MAGQEESTELDLTMYHDLFQFEAEDPLLRLRIARPHEKNIALTLELSFVIREVGFQRVQTVALWGMSTVLTLIQKQNLRRYVSPSVYKQGRAVFTEGKVHLLSLSDSSVNLLVEGENNLEYNVDFLLYDDQLRFECQCATFFETGLCKHIVAAHLFLQGVDASSPQLEEPLPVVDPETPIEVKGSQWRQQIEQALETASFHQEAQANTAVERDPFLIFFSLQTRSQRRVLLAYKVPAVALPDNLYSAERETVIGSLDEIEAHLLSNQSIGSELSIYTEIPDEACLNAGPGLIPLLTVSQKTYQVSNKQLVLTPYMREIAALGGPVFMGSQRSPFTKRVRVVQTPVEIGFELTRIRSKLKIVPQLWLAEDEAIPLPGKRDLIEAKQVWYIVD
ncbi:MAG: hypothetical protein AAF633_27125, partial [Chloroflexota bacterium]